MKPAFKVTRREYGSRTWSRKCVAEETRARLREEDRLEYVACSCHAITALDPCPYCGGTRPEAA